MPPGQAGPGSAT